ncbi:MAG: FKBP-type peptidyl-prolyl cis-trans isomerase, partial [Eubacterium sp.]|nr:FKBP-type peptidyl-prolyl cis-trans isomerase [Eubacterium sp.]
MKKKQIKNRNGSRKKTALIAVMAASMLMTACGSKEYLKDIKASKYVALGNYMGIEASADEPVVEDGLVDLYIQLYVLPQNATAEEVTDGKVETGDIANIDFTGYIDGETFDGGAGTGFDLTIGSHQFIDGFEDGLIGAKAGETRSLELAFPDPYENNLDLSGVPVVFEVTVNSITRQNLPEYTDEFVQSLNIEGCTTTKEFEDYLYDTFYQSEVQTYENTIENTLTDAIMANSTFEEPPTEMVNRFYQNLVDSMTAQATVQQMSLVQYMQVYYGMSQQDYEARFKEDALTQAQQYIMYQAIA